MKHIKSFESYIDDEEIPFRIVKCNWCNWIGKEDELTTDKDNYYTYCPKCGDDNYLMDILDPDDPLYSTYIANKKYNL